MRYLDENANLLEELKDLFLFLIGAKSVNGEPSSNDVIFVLFFQSFGISLSHNLQISTCTIKIQVGTKKKAVPINKFFQITSSHALLQDENLVLCLEPYHTIGMERVVHISKFNIKMHAGSADANNYVEYNPVSFGINSWDKDSLTNIQVGTSSDIVMISTPWLLNFSF